MLFKSIFSRQMSRRLGNLERDWPTGSPVTHAQSFFCSVGSAIFKFSSVRESLAAKQKDRLLSFLILNVIEAKIFHHVFLEGHNVWENNRY